MELTNQIIQEDLNKMYKKHNQWGAIVLYFIIIVLFVCFVSMSISQQITIIDTIAGILCKIALLSFALLVLEGATLSIYNFFQKNEVLEERYWIVIEANLSNKNKKKLIFEFLGGYKYIVDKTIFEQTKIGDRFYLVIVNKPGYSFVKHDKEVLYVYKKNDWERYVNSPLPVVNEKQKNKLTNKKIKMDLFLFNLPEMIEIILGATTVSCVIGTIFQVIKQQYVTFMQNYITFVLLFIVFCIVLFVLNKIQRYDKNLKLKNSLLIEDKNSYIFIVNKHNQKILVKIYPKYKFINLNSIVEEQKR